jgi:CPA2 family monovalent cation:H+ antiporter-2
MSESIHLAYAGFVLLLMFFMAYALKFLKFPYIVSFMLSGLLLRPFLPEHVSNFLSVFEHSAVALLFFFIGLEYSFERLMGMFKVVKVGFIDFFINFLPVFGASYAFTENLVFSLVLASAIYPSSTAITAKLFMDYKRLINPEVDLLIGILIFEDLICIILLSFLTSLASSGNLSLYFVSRSLLTLVLIFVLFYLIKDLVRVFFDFLERRIDESLFIFFTLGFLFFVSGLAVKYHISEAIVAFFLGVLVPENTRAFKIIDNTLSPIKELSLGLFFFFFTYKANMGGSADIPFAIGITLLSIILKLVSTYLSSLLYGFDKRISLRASLSFLQRGEFSLIFSGLYPPAQMITFILVLITSLIGSFSFVFAPKVANLIFPRRRSSKAPPQVP